MALNFALPRRFMEFLAFKFKLAAVRVYVLPRQIPLVCEI